MTEASRRSNDRDIGARQEHVVYSGDPMLRLWERYSRAQSNVQFFSHEIVG